MNEFRRIAIVGVILVTMIWWVDQSLGAAEAWKEKVVPSVLQHDPIEERDFFLYLVDQADLVGATHLSDKTAKTTYVVESLRETARRTQPALLNELRELGIEAKAFWIVNALLVTADQNVLEKMARRPDVAMIFGNPQGSPSESPQASLSFSAPPSPSTVTENLTLLGVPDVWALGATGEGVVVANLDSGVLWDHEALINRYRGWDGNTADHNYNWYDPTDEYPTEPFDPHGHGSLVMGVMVGDENGTHQVGVAPGARWIACNAFVSNIGWLDWYLASLQWIAAPTDLDGLNPDPSRAPDILQNSWGCYESEGCDDPLVILPAIDNLRAAGIFLVGAAGNSGPNCETVLWPPMIYEEVLTVGSTTMADEIWEYSSRGPVTVDGSGRLKPDVTAPTAQLSTYNDGAYAGPLLHTSWTSPHASGLAALLISANPDLRGNVDALEDIIRLTAVPKMTEQECGGVPGSEVPNNTYGWGRIDALAAHQAAVYGAIVSVDDPQQVFTEGDQVAFGDVNLMRLGLSSDTYDVSINTTFLPAGWSAHLAHEGGEHQSFAVTLEPDESSLFHVVMDIGDIEFGRVLVDIASQGAGGEIIETVEYIALTGNNDLLIVSDDGGAGHAYDVYGPALESTGKSYGVWNQALAAITGDELLGYDAIIWQTGDENVVLKAEDRTALDTYLSAGGDVFLAGEDILESLNAQGGQAALWLQLKFRFSFAAGSSGDYDIIGLPGTVGDGLAFTLTGGDPDQLNLVTGQPVEVAFEFGNGEPAGTQTTYNDYQIMYLPFGLERVPASVDQSEIVGNVLTWFGLLDPAGADDMPLAVTQLLPNAPNPFNPVTRISFSLARTGPTKLEIYDARGYLVRVLVDEIIQPGAHSIVWDGMTTGGQQAASGTYFYRLTTEGVELTNKMSLVK